MKNHIISLAKNTNVLIKNSHHYFANVYTGGLQEVNAKIQKYGSASLEQRPIAVNHKRRMRRYMQELVAKMKAEEKTNKQIKSALLGYSLYYAHTANLIPNGFVDNFNSHFSPIGWVRAANHFIKTQAGQITNYFAENGTSSDSIQIETNSN